MANKLKNIIQALDTFDRQRIFWLELSVFVVLTILSVIWKWDFVQYHHLGWVLFALGTTVSVIWWYWTMKLIRLTIEHRKAEVEVLIDIVEDIRAIKGHVDDLKK